MAGELEFKNNEGPDQFEDDGALQNEKYGSFDEIGHTGLKRASGTIDEEFLPALRGERAIRVYREMHMNEPIISAMIYSIDRLVRQIEWSVVTADNSPEQAEAKEFLEQCMNDMSQSWGDLISEIMSMTVYGWSWHEIVYKRRLGPHERDPRKRSKFDDGRIGWRKMPIRSQDSWFRWHFDEEGGIRAMTQMPAPTYKQRTIPIERSLLFRTGSHKGNPEGVSMLRSAYRPWYMKKRLEEYEAVGVERDLAGMPVAWVPSEWIHAPKGSREAAAYQAFKRMVQNVRRDQHDGLVMPLEYDSNGKERVRFELMSGGGSRQFDTSGIIQRYEQRILMSCLSDFLLLGHEGVGSYSMHVDKTGIFRTALNTIAQSIADVFNRHAIPRLFEINGWRLDELPRIEPGSVDAPDLSQLSQFMQSMTGMGMQFFPDPDLESFLRRAAQLPPLTPEQEEQRRLMADQQQQLGMMDSAMQLENSQQTAELMGQGMSMEQAQMTQQGQHPAQVAGEQEAEAEGSMIAQQNPAVQAMQQAEAEQEQQAAEQEFQREDVKAEKDAFRQQQLERLKARSKPAPKKK